jgi:SAM-dependent methyltransferase
VIKETCEHDIDSFIGEAWRDSYMLQSENVRDYITDPSALDRTSNNRVYHKLLDTMRECDARCILDVGCNAGYMYDYLLSAYKQDFGYVGVDINARMIDEAIALHNDRCEFVVADLFNLPESYLFDVVFCARVLIHLPDFEKAVRALYDATRKALVLTLKIAPTDKCDRYAVDDSMYYLRAVSTATLDRIGIDYTVHDTGKYKTVVMVKEF